MPAICFYFQVHQPHRVKRYRAADIGRDDNYFNDDSETNLNNQKILRRVAERCYLPANHLLLALCRRYPELRLSFSLSGVALEQLAVVSPDALASFQTLAETGQVEFLGETYYHSLSFLYSRAEFKRQVKLHQQLIKKWFRQTPRVFRHTELIYNNQLAAEVSRLGFEAIIAEGADHILGGRSPNFVYRPAGLPALKLLLKNYRLSDDIAFRFTDRSAPLYPLTAAKFAAAAAALRPAAVLNLFMDYETFGEHQWRETGIFDFLRDLPREVLRRRGGGFVTVTEAVRSFAAVDVIDAPRFYSWADTERDLSAWLENSLQQSAADRIYALEDEVLATGDGALITAWRRLQTSDHLYYMCTKWWQDGDVHKYFNPYRSPYEAFVSVMNALEDLRQRVSRAHV